MSPGAVRRLETDVGRCGERSAQGSRCHLQVPRLDAESQSPDRPLELARAPGGQKQKLRQLLVTPILSRVKQISLHLEFQANLEYTVRHSL